MNKLIILSALVIVAGLFGCRATPYQRLGATPTGGYSEKAMSQDRFHVKFSANDRTSPGIVRGYLYRRAAEVTLRYGFIFFAVARGPDPFTDRTRFSASKDSYDDVPPPIEIDVLKGSQLQMVIGIHQVIATTTMPNTNPNRKRRRCVLTSPIFPP